MSDGTIIYYANLQDLKDQHVNGYIYGYFVFDGIRYYAQYKFAYPIWKGSYKEHILIHGMFSHPFIGNKFHIEDVGINGNIIYMKLEKKFVPKKYLWYNYANFDDLRTIQFCII